MKFTDILNILAAAVLFIAIAAVCVISCNHISSSISPELKEKITIEYRGVDINDTANAKLLYKSYCKSIDSVNDVVFNRLNNYDERLQVFVDAKKDESNFNKLFTATVAFIVAIATFFGFKSINEIKEQAIDKAKAEAINEANKTASTIALQSASMKFAEQFDSDYRSMVFEDAKKAAIKILSEDLERINTELSNKDKRIDELEIKLRQCCDDNDKRPKVASENETNSESIVASEEQIIDPFSEKSV